VKKDKLKKVVREECGYWRRGECIGIPEGCLISRGRQCGWFAEAVLPLFPELRKKYEELEEEKKGGVRNA